MGRHSASSLVDGFRFFGKGRRRGATALEYGILSALILGVIIGAVRVTGVNLANLFGGFSASVNAVAAPSAASGLISYGAWTLDSWTSVSSSGSTNTGLTCTSPSSGSTNNVILSQTSASLGINGVTSCSTSGLTQGNYLNLELSSGSTSSVTVPAQDGSLTTAGSFKIVNSAAQPSYLAFSPTYAAVYGYDWSLNSSTSDQTDMVAAYNACQAEGGTVKNNMSAGGYVTMDCGNVPNYSFSQQTTSVLNTTQP